MMADETNLTFTSGVVPVNQQKKKGQVNGEVELLI
jgi:hypothetical protein